MTYNEVMFSQTLAEIDAVTKKIFQLEDQVYLIVNKEPIDQGRAGSKVLPLILKKLNGIECLTMTSYEQITDGERSVLEQFFISTPWANVKQTRLFQGLINQDFPDRRPQIKQANLRCAPQIYLINLRTKLIFHLYDDRGYELYFTNQESLAKFQAELLNNAN